jgi:L-fuculose-phosphate aldolase
MKFLTAKDVEQLLLSGEDINAALENAKLTPSARDLLRQPINPRSSRNGNSTVSNQSNDLIDTPWGQYPDPSIGVEKFFTYPVIQRLKEDICDIGRRLWQRAYVDGNGGNISIRVGENLALCTPTLVSKGFMKPEDLCLVDLEGDQKAGQNRRTSEILMHLAIMKKQVKAKSVVHCHPPHATAFAVAGVKPPTCMIPEIEVFIGEVPLVPYSTPGTPELGRQIAELADNHNTILMANHGVVSWGKNVEDAYFKMEIIEAYARTVVVASQLGTELKTFTKPQLNDLLEIKKTLDIPDSRFDLKECELCDNNEWRPGITCTTPSTNGNTPAKQDVDPQTEELVNQITTAIMERLNSPG